MESYCCVHADEVTAQGAKLDATQRDVASLKKEVADVSKLQESFKGEHAQDGNITSCRLCCQDRLR